MRHPAWHKEWNTWAKKRWIDFLCEIPWSWAARELNIRPDFAVEEPGVTVGNLNGVARVKLDTGGELAKDVQSLLFVSEYRPLVTQGELNLPVYHETCGPCKSHLTAESLAKITVHE